MKIAIVTYSLKVGGVETMIEILADSFLSARHGVDIIETHNRGEGAKYFEAKGFSVISRPISLLETRVGHVKRIAELLRKYDYIILNNSIYAQSIAGLLPDECVVISVLHNELFEIVDVAASNIQNIDKVVCVSKALEQCIPHTDKTVVIPNGVIVPRAWEKEETNFSSKAKLKLAFLGRVFDKSKGVFLLVDIVDKLSKSNCEEFALTIIGDGESLPKLRSMVAERKLSDYFLFLGQLDRDAALGELAKHDVLLMPSYSEGQGLVYLEAMANGVIPVVSRLENNTVLVIQEKLNGFLCEVGNAEEFAGAIKSLISNPALRRKMSENAWTTARTELSVEIMVEKYYALYEAEKSGSRDKRNGRIDTSLIRFQYVPFVFISIYLYLKKLLKNHLAR